MKTTIRYNQATKRERIEAARKDCEFYLGDGFTKIVANIREFWQNNAQHGKKSAYRIVAVNLEMFCGVQGRYPVAALMRAALEPVPAPVEGRNTIH